MPINVYTTANSEVCSRQELINWFSNILGQQYKKIEELSDGIAYCNIMNILFPNCIQISKINKKARLENDKLVNWKLMQAAFKRLNIDKAIPAEKLIKSRFLDNLEFAQWFKCFYDANNVAAYETQNNFDLNTTLSYDSVNSEYHHIDNKANITQDIMPNEKLELQQHSIQNKSSPLTTSNSYSNETILMEKASSSLTEATQQLDALAQDLDIAVRERQFYYEKLRKIEILLEKYDVHSNPLAGEVYEILYQIEEGFVIPDNEEMDEFVTN